MTSSTIKFRFVDLFAGIGGFHRALASFDGECAMACEIDSEAQQVYKHQFPKTPLVDDIRSITCLPNGADRPLNKIGKMVPDHDVLCAGFPCQPFSKSGFQLGVRDQTRGTLFFDLMQIVRAKKPKFIMLENVRNLAGPRHHDTWRTIIASLRIEGYAVADEPLIFSPHLLPREDGGAPQIRDRVFILGWLDEKACKGSHPYAPLVPYEPVNGWNPKNWNIESILDDDSQIPNIQRYGLRKEEMGWLDAWGYFIKMIPSDWLPGFPIWVDEFKSDLVIPEGTPSWKSDFMFKNHQFYRDHSKLINKWLKRRWGPLEQRMSEFPASRRKFEWQARVAQPRMKDRDIWKLVIHLRPSGIRVKPATYLPALVAITQTSIIGSRRRRITPREAAKLQGFPPNIFDDAQVEDKHAYRQLGNAVNIGVVKFLANALFTASAGDSPSKSIPKEA